MTGAPVPSGCTAVVPFEWTSEEGTGDRREVVVRRAPDEGQHIRRAGEEITEGDVLMRAGEVIGPRQLGLLAAAGHGRVPTAPRPRVVVMSTGTELVEPGRPLGRDSIYDANSYLLAAAVRAHGGVAYRVTATTDDPDDFTEALSDQLVRADLVVTSGGVSKGTHDVVKEVLGEPRHGRLPRGGDAAGQAAGLRVRGRGPDADLHAARQPGLGLRLLRDVRRAGAAQAEWARGARAHADHGAAHRAGALDARGVPAAACAGRHGRRGPARDPRGWCRART